MAQPFTSLELSKAEATRLIEELNGTDKFWVVAYVGSKGFVKHDRQIHKQSLVAIWRDSPDEARFAIVREPHFEDYIAVDFYGIEWGGSYHAKTFAENRLFRDLDQAIMACAMTCA